MPIRKTIRKIKTGLGRKADLSMPENREFRHETDAAEGAFFFEVLTRFPTCRIRQNVLLPSGVKIDCLLALSEKLFAVEVKCWRGTLVEEKDGVAQTYSDGVTSADHRIVHPSPLIEIRDAATEFSETYGVFANPVVYFAEEPAVTLSRGIEWFTDMEAFAEYAAEGGIRQDAGKIARALSSLTLADVVVPENGQKVYCTVSDDSLVFHFGERTLTRKDVFSVAIEHGFVTDTVTVTCKDGEVFTEERADGSVTIVTDGEEKSYPYYNIFRIIPHG